MILVRCGTYGLLRCVDVANATFTESDTGFDRLRFVRDVAAGVNTREKSRPPEMRIGTRFDKSLSRFPLFLYERGEYAGEIARARTSCACNRRA